MKDGSWLRMLGFTRGTHRTLHTAVVGVLLACTGCTEAPEIETNTDTDRPAPRVDDGHPADEPADPPPADPPEPSSPADDACGAVSDYVEGFGAPTTCDAELAAICTDLSAVFSEDYLRAVAECVDEDHSPMLCLLTALGTLEPSEAHLTLAERFCDECALGFPGCEHVFYFEDDEPIGLGIVALPFSDALVLEIAEQCTESTTCALDLPSCAQDVIESHLQVEGLLDCVLDAIDG